MAWHDLGDLGAWWTASHVATTAWIAVTWLVALVLLRWNDRFFDRLDTKLTRYNVPERKLSQLDSLSDALIVSVGALLTLYLLGVGEALWGAIALTSISGVVVGLAAQRFGQNLIAGGVILFERPFQVGDDVEVGGQMGTVEAVTLHSTTLTTPDGLLVTMPNQKVLDGAVTNVSACRQRRVTLTVDVDVGEERLEEARSAIEEAIGTEEHLVDEPAPVVFVSEGLQGRIRFAARYWVQADAYTDHCRPTAIRRVLDALDREGFGPAMPAQAVQVRD